MERCEKSLEVKECNNVFAVSTIERPRREASVLQQITFR